MPHRNGIAQLDRLKADRRRLADPRGLSGGDADRLIRDLPIVTRLMHAVHGNEISSSDAALAEAYHLLAATNDPDVPLIPCESIVVIDPMQNLTAGRFVAIISAGAAAGSTPIRIRRNTSRGPAGVRIITFDMNRD